MKDDIEKLHIDFENNKDWMISLLVKRFKLISFFLM